MVALCTRASPFVIFSIRGEYNNITGSKYAAIQLFTKSFYLQYKDTNNIIKQECYFNMDIKAKPGKVK